MTDNFNPKAVTADIEKAYDHFKQERDEVILTTIPGIKLYSRVENHRINTIVRGRLLDFYKNVLIDLAQYKKDVEESL